MLRTPAPAPAAVHTLDFALPADPSAIFIRKQALVLNLEGLKLIIGRCGSVGRVAALS